MVCRYLYINVSGFNLVALGVPGVLDALGVLGALGSGGSKRSREKSTVTQMLPLKYERGSVPKRILTWVYGQEYRILTIAFSFKKRCTGQGAHITAVNNLQTFVQVTW